MSNNDHLPLNSAPPVIGLPVPLISAVHRRSQYVRASPISHGATIAGGPQQRLASLLWHPGLTQTG
jgi:hypothetical protein